MKEWQDIKVEILHKLVKLSNNLGRKNYHLAIIGEGNTSAKVEVDSWLNGKHSHVFNLVKARFGYIRKLLVKGVLS